MGLPAPSAPTCCRAAIEFVATEGRAAECPTCGLIYLPDDSDRASDVELRPRERAPHAPLAQVLEAVSLALAVRAENDVTPRRPLSPIAKAQGRTELSTSDASAGTTARLWRLVTEPAGRVGRDRRAGFVDALVRYCDATSRPDTDEIDWTAARRFEEQLGRLDAESRRTLATVARRCRPSVSWDAAALVVADELAPRALRDRWTTTRSASRAAPPPELEALAWGEDVLTSALIAWTLATRGGA